MEINSISDTTSEVSDTTSEDVKSIDKIDYIISNSGLMIRKIQSLLDDN